jgi:hypothetical protein
MLKLFQIALISMLLLQHVVIAQQSTESCQAGNKNTFTIVEAPALYSYRTGLAKTAVGTINVIYDGNVPPDFHAPVEEAVKIWSYLIKTTSPIKIGISASALDTKILASTIASIANGFTGGQSNTDYVTALAKQLSSSYSFANNDMQITINTSQSWYLGTDGVPHKDQYDLVSTLVHEIAHGLGFTGSMFVNNSLGYYGRNYDPTNVQGPPYIYDRFGFANNKKLIEETSPSVLGSMLVGGQVYFDGGKSIAANRGAKPRLYAPSAWQNGSSFCHLDEDTYPTGNTNGLMTPFGDMAEITLSPGEIGLAMLQDLGWTVERMAVVKNPMNAELVTKGSNYLIKWYDNAPDKTITYNIAFELYQLTPTAWVYVSPVHAGFVPSIQGFQNQYAWPVPAFLADGTYLLKVKDDMGHYIGQSMEFTISPTVPKPVFSVQGGLYASPQTVALSTSIEGGEIYYTTDGTEPDKTKIRYSGQPISISQSITVKSKVFLTLTNGAIASSATAIEDYTIKQTTLPAPYYCSATSYFYDSRNSGSYGSESYGNIGRSGTLVYRTLIAPPIADIQRIPQDATIEHAELVLYLRPMISGTASQDIVIGEAGLTGTGSDMRYNDIGNATELTKGTTSQEKLPLSKLVTTLQKIVKHQQSSLYLGVKLANESNDKTIFFFEYDAKLVIYYRTHDIEVMQVSEAGIPFGQVALWEDSQWKEKGQYFELKRETRQSIILKAQQSFKENTTEKFIVWKANEDLSYTNFNSFNVKSEGLNTFTANFKTADNTVFIRTSLIDAPNICGGQIEFRDPWFIDYPDPTYGKRNRDLNTEQPYLRPVGSTGFNPVGQYPEGTYQGVFLNQNPGYITTQPIYSLSALPSQTIGNYQAQFINWSSPNGSVQYQSPNAQETKVVFKTAGATATAVYKGYQVSSTTSATANNNQRKMAYYNGKSYLVYESGGEIWLTSSTNGGTSWINEIRLSDGDGNNSQPSIDAFKMGSGSSNDGLSVVWQHIASPNGINYFLFINARLSDAAATEWGPIQIVTPSMTQVPSNFSGATPVIARTYASYGDPYSKITVVYHGWGTHGAGTFDRVYLSYANNISYTMSSFSSPISLNWYQGNLPTICRKATDNHVVGLAWKENNNPKSHNNITSFRLY